MRTFGLVLLVIGLFGFFYCQGEMQEHDPLPAGLSIEAALRLPAGRLQVGQYAAGFVGAVGLLALMFPKGR